MALPDPNQRLQDVFNQLDYWTRRENAHRLAAGEISPEDLVEMFDEFLEAHPDKQVAEGFCDRAMGASLMLGNPKEPNWDRTVQLMVGVGRKHGVID